MPPRAMPSSVSVAIRSASTLPVRTCSRRSRPTVEAAGNLGAPPNPPQSGSKAERSTGMAPVRSSPVSGSVDGATSRRTAQSLRQRRTGLHDLPATLAPGIVDRSQHLAERGHAVARLGRVVRPAVERLARRRQEHGHRPPAVAGHPDHRVHVDGVEIGPLLAVDLDVHEHPVHQLGGLRVLERLVRHDVAPVAGGVADREQDRPILGAGALERLLPPRVPLDRVLGVLEQVRAGLVGEPVHAPHVSGGECILDGVRLNGARPLLHGHRP